MPCFRNSLENATLQISLNNWYKNSNICKKESSTVTGIEWPGGFQEVKVPRFLDNGTGWW
jgi:hypothetical protein